jgi:murein DD-endopeptidase MepM/ murein hydrolase activator NlpD
MVFSGVVMNIIWVSKRLGDSRQLTINPWGLLIIGVILVVLLPSLAWLAGYSSSGELLARQHEVVQRYKSELTQRRQELERVRMESDSSLMALTMQLGQMQAHVVRLNALGERLTQKAKLDGGEFDFTSPPARGGPEDLTQEQTTLPLADLLAQIDNLAIELRDREQQLRIFEQLLLNRELQAESVPQGRPILSGWISSQWGKRTDPFTGKQESHMGVDLAGREGSEVISVASGIVTFSGRRFGYGNMVEIDHGGGYMTRYAHNKSNKVKIGETVRKGDVVALMGSTGRSTGPHVHFEVWRDGVNVNPSRYLRAEALRSIVD